MISKTSNKIKESLGRKNVKTYFFFLAFTSFLWLALQFSKNHSQEVVFDLAFSEIEKDKIVKPNSDNTIKMVLEGNGFQLVKYSIFKKTIYLDARKAKKDSKSHTYFTGKSMINAIKSSLNYDGEIPDVFKDSLHIYYDVFKEKSVQVKLKSKINYAAGYTSVKGLQAKDSQVKVLGPKSIIDTLSFVTTEELKLDRVNKNYNGVLAIKKNRNLRFDKKNISVSLDVDKLTEGEFKIPITILNIPKKTKVQLFPKQVSVIFNVLLNDLPKLSAADFKVVADLSNASENTNELLLTLAAFPSNVYSARLTENEVQYIVIKK